MCNTCRHTFWIISYFLCAVWLMAMLKRRWWELNERIKNEFHSEQKEEVDSRDELMWWMENYEFCIGGVIEFKLSVIWVWIMMRWVDDERFSGKDGKLNFAMELSFLKRVFRCKSSFLQQNSQEKLQTSFHPLPHSWECFEWKSQYKYINKYLN